MEELNSGPPKTNPSSGREEDLNPGPPDYKSSALTTRPRCLRTVLVFRWPGIDSLLDQPAVITSKSGLMTINSQGLEKRYTILFVLMKTLGFSK